MITKLIEELRVDYTPADLILHSESRMRRAANALEALVLDRDRQEHCADILALRLSSIVDVVTTDHESKADFVARIRAIIDTDPSLHVSTLRKERDELAKELTEAKAEHHCCTCQGSGEIDQTLGCQRPCTP